MTTDPITGETTAGHCTAQGTFVFRLAGRERQQSASYYTPEVLTRFVVSQALEELLDQDGTTTTAAEILELTICEPALGSGAFAIEAVRQLADAVPQAPPEASSTRPIDPDDYPRELQKVKAYLALHQVYGVDLNATAVELAEISLWLDTMVEGLEAPWFGLHLRRGNSLIGARKAVFTPRRRSRTSPGSRRCPTRGRLALGRGAETLAGRIPHFLLPADGWGAAADVGKDIKDLVPDAVDGPEGPGAGRCGPSRRRSRSTRSSTWASASRRCGRSPPGGSRSPTPRSAATSRSGDASRRRSSREHAKRRPPVATSPARRSRSRSPTPTAPTAGCAGSWTPGARSGSGRSPRTTIKPPTLEQWYDALDDDPRRRHDDGQVVAKRATRPSRAAIDLGRARRRPRKSTATSPAPLASTRCSRRHPWLTVCERIADAAGLLPLGARLRAGLRDAAASTCRSGTRLGAAHARTSRRCWPRAIRGGSSALKPTQKQRRQLDASTTLELAGIRELVIDGTAT